MSKKYISLTSLIIVLSLVLAACGNNGGNNEGNAVNKNTDGKVKKPDVEILNVSYDPTRELYEQFNAAFAAHWLEKEGQKVTIQQSHGGSGKQGRAVIDGLKADVVTLALAYDIDEISQNGLIDEGWLSELEHNSAPYTSTIVFLVRKDNPKNIQDWDDLAKKGVEVITPNPKTSGGARWNFLAAWAYALKHNNNSEEAAQSFVTDIFKNVPVLDSGARGSTTTFVERGIGDVLITWENEAYLALNELKEGEFEIVTPSISILAEPSVAVVDKNVDNKGTREVAEAYLNFLYTEQGQELAAKNYYRPRLESVANKYKDQFKEIELITIDDVFGGWNNAQTKFFKDGGVFDEIYKP